MTHDTRRSRLRKLEAARAKQVDDQEPLSEAERYQRLEYFFNHIVPNSEEVLANPQGHSKSQIAFAKDVLCRAGKLKEIIKRAQARAALV